MKNKIARFIKLHKSTLVYILVIALIVTVGSVYKFNKEKNAEASLLGIPVQDYEEYMKELDNTPSDIEGMTQYDKYKMGLNYHDNSDTDYDGLTDKEEIEKYGSDPLKASTADDLYSDGYKVKNEMDLFKNYEYDKEIVFEYNECPEVILEADEPTDFYAVVEDYTTRYSLEDYGIDTIYKGYWMYNYNGTVEIDLTEILKNNNIDLKDISVWVYQGDFLAYGLSDLEKCGYRDSGNVITLDYDFDSNLAYYVYITEHKSAISSFLSVNKDSASPLQLNGSSDEVGIAFVCGSPILEQFFGVSGHVYYMELDDAAKNTSFMERAIYYCNNVVLGSEITSEDTDKLTATDAEGVQSKINFYKSFFPMCEAKPAGQESVFNFIFNYTIYADEGYDLAAGTENENGDEEEHKNYRNYHTTFDPYVDELPFQNFESEYGTGGNCAGISHLTAYLFNTGSFPTSGTYGDISWDLNIDEENTTLSDLGLYDYKSREFVDENSGNNDNHIGEGLSAGEQEFVKMIGAYWKESNDKAKLNDYVMVDGQTNDWSLAEKMTGYLDKGKILCVGMLFKSGMGHEVNLYDYYYTEAGELIFRVYDSNIPQNNRDGYELNCDGACYLQCKEIIRPDGTSSFTYLYWPIKGNIGYMASSNKNLMNVNSIVVTDENWNIFNE